MEIWRRELFNQSLAPNRLTNVQFVCLFIRGAAARGQSDEGIFPSRLVTLSLNIKKHSVTPKKKKKKGKEELELFIFIFLLDLKHWV